MAGLLTGLAANVLTGEACPWGAVIPPGIKTGVRPRGLSCEKDGGTGGVKGGRDGELLSLETTLPVKLGIELRGTTAKGPPGQLGVFAPLAGAASIAWAPAYGLCFCEVAHGV
mmetsp:Transcript_43598/g.100491  ORF Transcript_43598/g.100491 Transcript_43598/m.100491 type:complete len:113 (+) Transcript_43598:2217-2555(+)